LKTSVFKYIIVAGAAAFAIACSTKKDSFVNRNWHAVTTEYNVLYNGELALDAGLVELKKTYTDNYWEILPTERMQMTEEQMGPTDAKNPNFERSETKATKAIQKHSMNIGNMERNPQMDEAHLLLGKTRYYDNRFIPALEAFNYILYKHPHSDKIYEAKVWREKTNLRLENEGTAIKNLKVLIKEKELDEQVNADANATLAQAYIATEALDSAVAPLKKAIDLTKENEERARYRFILGQVYDKLNYKDSAYASYQNVIEMNRKSPRRYVIQAHAAQAGQFDFTKGDTLAFMEKYRDLLKDRENRPFLDVINHQIGLFYDRQDDDARAIQYYNTSLRAKSADKYLNASNHRNIAEIYFKQARYPLAGMYYDSTMVFLNNRTREYRQIKKKRDNLADVIKYEAIANTNDSILRLVAFSDTERRTFFENYIVKLKENEAKAKELAERQASKQAGTQIGGGIDSPDPVFMGDQKARPDRAPGDQSAMKPRTPAQTPSPAAATPITASAGNSKFYFYNPSTVSFGIIEFQKRWGKRPLTDNWRWAAEQRNRGNQAQDDPTVGDDPAGAAGNDIAKGEEGKIDARYMPEFYISQLPTSQKVIDSLAKDRNFAYYQLGTIYHEKFAEHQRAADKLEKLLTNNPEERLILPSYYNLYKIYQIIDPSKAEVYKQKVLTQYPDSRYAEIIRNPGSDAVAQGTPQQVYRALFKRYEKGELRGIAAQTDTYIENYTGEDIVSKFEMLKANISGRFKGIEEYRQGLNFVALNYPNSQEGKEAEALLKTNVPAMEKVTFGAPSTTWKVIFKVKPDDAKNKVLTDKLQKFIKEGLNNSITLSQDIYTVEEDFIVLHGFNSKLAAIDAVTILKDYKGYKVAENPIIISTEDYKVVQIKKNLPQFQAIK
jgi:tetratricopeptide (TPR) repeat protein